MRVIIWSKFITADKKIEYQPIPDIHRQEDTMTNYLLVKSWLIKSTIFHGDYTN